MTDKIALGAVLMTTLAGACSTGVATAAQPDTGTTAVAQTALQSPSDQPGTTDERPLNEPTPMTP
ncbi:MAG: hypothetical protein WCC36_07060, partial [Gammaproteobacteria bacterium]